MHGQKIIKLLQRVVNKLSLFYYQNSDYRLLIHDIKMPGINLLLVTRTCCINSENGGSIFLRNIFKFLLIFKANIQEIFVHFKVNLTHNTRNVNVRQIICNFKNTINDELISIFIIYAETKFRTSQPSVICFHKIQMNSITTTTVWTKSPVHLQIFCDRNLFV